MELESVTHSEHVSYRMPLTGPVELYTERPAVVWVPDAYGRMVPMPKDQAPAPMQPMAPRDLTPLPLLDPVAQRVVACGIGAGAAGAGVGWGVGQAFAGIAAFGGITSLAVIAALLLLARLSRGSNTTITNTTTVHNTNRWFGKSTTSSRQG
jgi:hypothetical protein